MFLYDQSDTQNSLEGPQPQNFATAQPPLESCFLLALHLEAELCSSENAEHPLLVLRSCFLPTASDGLPPPPWVPSTQTSGRCYRIRKDNPGQASFHTVKSRTNISYCFLIHPCMVTIFQGSSCWCLASGHHRCTPAFPIQRTNRSSARDGIGQGGSFHMTP